MKHFDITNSQKCKCYFTMSVFMAITKLLCLKLIVLSNDNDDVKRNIILLTNNSQLIKTKNKYSNRYLLILASISKGFPK